MTPHTIVRYTHNSDHFEILVKPDPALEYRTGKKVSLSTVLVSEDVYTDSGKGTRASDESMMAAFGTADTAAAAKTILERGTLNLTTEQRRRMTEAKRLQIVERISKTYVDPRTHLPHPPLRIQQAMQDARVSIDPQSSVHEQLDHIVEQLRKVMPLRTEMIRLNVEVPAQYASRSYPVLKSAGTLTSTDWQSNGSLKAILEISAASRPAVIDRLNQTTRGTAMVEVSE